MDKHLIFSINYEEYQHLEEILKNYPVNVELEVNEYLRRKGNNILVEKTTFYIPVSINLSKKKVNKHAKFNKWYEINYKNLEIDLSNSKRNYYYLYYVANFMSTSDPRKQKTGVGGIDFFEDGANKAYPIVREELLDLLESKLKEKL